MNKVSYYSNLDTHYEKSQKQREYKFYLSFNCKRAGKEACDFAVHIVNGYKDYLSKSEIKLQKKIFKKFNFNLNLIQTGDLVLISNSREKQCWIKEPISGWRLLREEIDSCLLH